MLNRDEFKKLLKLVGHTLSGAAVGYLSVILWFIHEKSHVRDLPYWGHVLSVIGVIGGAYLGYISYRDFYGNDESGS